MPLLALALAGCAGTDGTDDAAVSTATAPAVVDPPDAGAATSAPADADATSAPADAGAATSGAPDALELPRGGTELFPHYRLVGYVGYPGSAGMGRLGIGDLDDRAAEIETELADYAGDREIQPVLELVVSIAHPVPGADGTYRTHVPEEMIQEHLDAARRHDALLLLNIQAGAVDFLDEVRSFETWLDEPDVGLALDPEWAVEPGQVPGQVYGRTTGAELDDVAGYLSDLVDKHHLPEKALVFHQVHSSVVRDEGDLRRHPGVAIIRSVDGIGHPLDKTYTYELVTEGSPAFVHGGFKLFLEEDRVLGPLMTAEEVLALDPEVEYLMVE